MSNVVVFNVDVFSRGKGVEDTIFAVYRVLKSVEFKSN